MSPWACLKHSDLSSSKIFKRDSFNQMWQHYLIKLYCIADQKDLILDTFFLYIVNIVSYNN